jgi:hypothetical protein
LGYGLLSVREKLRAVLPFTVGIRDRAVHLVSTFGSAVISALAALRSIITSALWLPVAAVLTHPRVRTCGGGREGVRARRVPEQPAVLSQRRQLRLVERHLLLERGCGGLLLLLLQAGGELQRLPRARARLRRRRRLPSRSSDFAATGNNSKKQLALG